MINSKKISSAEREEDEKVTLTLTVTATLTVTLTLTLTLTCTYALTSLLPTSYLFIRAAIHSFIYEHIIYIDI